MAELQLSDLTLAMMVANGFNETEFAESQRALLKTGAKLKTISTEQGLVNGWHGMGWGHYFAVDSVMGDVLAADLGVLILPGGSRSINKLKSSLHTRRIITHMIDGDKPVICFNDGIELLALSDRLAGRTVAAPQTHHDVVTRAGATVAEGSVARDGNILTLSLSPELTLAAAIEEVLHFLRSIYQPEEAPEDTEELAAA